jgi:hypothetical protein
MPSRQHEYWSHARDCERWAIEADSEAHKKSFLEMAKTWTRLALYEAAVEFPAPQGRHARPSN